LHHPPALRLERSIHDLFGLTAEGLPDTRPWLDHDQWGVRIPLSVGNRDMYYKIVKYQGGIGEGAKIYSKDFNDRKNANNVACADEAYPLLVISRVSQQRGALMNNPNMPEYDPTSGPYKTYEFQTEYAFGPSRDGLGLPPCANLNAGTGRAFSADKTVTDALKQKKSAVTDGYAKLQAVPVLIQ